jgi:ferritin
VLSEKLQKALNEQINAEYHSAYLYLSMASYLDSINLDGCAHWMQIQAQEELMHGMKIYDYILERGGRVLLQPVEGPPTEWSSVQEAFEAAQKHERMMTGLVNDLANLAQTEKDNATNNLMQWFVDEQVEEEATVDDIVQKIILLGGQGPGLFMLDRELKARTFVPLDSAGSGT